MTELRIDTIYGFNNVPYIYEIKLTEVGGMSVHSDDGNKVDYDTFRHYDYANNEDEYNAIILNLVSKHHLAETNMGEWEDKATVKKITKILKELTITHPEYFV